MTSIQPNNDQEYEYESERVWRDARPHILVVCCSDGRLQEAVDDFLRGDGARVSDLGEQAIGALDGPGD